MQERQIGYSNSVNYNVYVLKDNQGCENHDQGAASFLEEQKPSEEITFKLGRNWSSPGREVGEWHFRQGGGVDAGVL